MTSILPISSLPPVYFIHAEITYENNPKLASLLILSSTVLIFFEVISGEPP